ncbi:class I SAM-dependent methyltransferase [Ilumatobacter nonamiensis]|uniref:class I SAM-dependent methyltransferase n=1 Tax=Ilumatobacter nonamiensis TaxID=467093 RepID=UPI000345E343|nr:class I SAM-dependent methyltransferase [Ilumatobacter nonamiensis]
MTGHHWFEPLAEHMGEAYLRYSFTKGTVQEVDHIVEALGLSTGDRVLDVGCGPGRHAHELARRGMVVHGIDISQPFIDLAVRDAPDGATFERLDARSLAFDAEFDAVICLCQGAFGLMTANGDDDVVVDGMSRALKPGGRLALSAFSAYFVVKHWEGAEFDADTGVNHERTEVRSESGESLDVDLWTGCYTPRELRMLADRHRLSVDRISSVEPGAYGNDEPSVDTAEFLVLATRVAERA